MLSRKIFTQQDRAKNHSSCEDKLFNNALVDNGINATLYTQAVNSPDVNLLDYGIFRAIQSFNDTAPKNEKELIEGHTTSIPGTRSIKSGLPYNAASTRSSCTMETMITTLTILGKSNWNEMEIYLTLWMWWRMWQTYAITMTQTMTTATMTTLMMKTPLPKTKRIPILPTHKWEDGSYGQRLSHRCRGVVFLFGRYVLYLLLNVHIKLCLVNVCCNDNYSMSGTSIFEISWNTRKT